MDAKEMIVRSFANMRRTTDAVLGGLTEEQLNWAPPGTANSIGVTLVHIASSEDMFVNELLQGKTQVWQKGEWGAKLELSGPPGRVAGWDEIKSKKLSLEQALGYEKAVRAATDNYLAELSKDDLERAVKLLGMDRQTADVFALVVVHGMSHVGEISTLKGLQGAKGLPY